MELFFVKIFLDGPPRYKVIHIYCRQKARNRLTHMASKAWNCKKHGVKWTLYGYTMTIVWLYDDLCTPYNDLCTPYNDLCTPYNGHSMVIQ